MIILLSWLRDFIKFDYSPHDLAGLLTNQGIEAATITLLKDKISDLESVEIAALLPSPFEGIAKYAVKSEGHTLNLFSSDTSLEPEDTVLGRIFPSEIDVESLDSTESVKAAVSDNIIPFIPTLEDLHINSLRSAVHLPEEMDLGLLMDEAIIEFETPTNRGDLLSYLGVAREVAYLLEKDGKEPFIKMPDGIIIPPQDAPSGKKIGIAAPKDCPRYVGLTLSDVDVKRSPTEVLYRLLLSGVKPVNNVVDISNYVMYELGQPLHPFDADLIGDAVIIRRAEKGEKMVAINHIEYSLAKENLLITDEKGPIAIAGVMGGLRSEIGEKTRTVFLESAFFNNRRIRSTAKRSGLHSDSSLRFGRGVDFAGVPRAAKRFAHLLQNLGIAKVQVNTYKDVEPCPIGRTAISFPASKIEKILGIPVTVDDLVRKLKQLGCEVSVNRKRVTAVVPSYRPDLNIVDDLSEEIMRLIGYSELPSDLPSLKLLPGSYEDTFIFEERVRDIALRLGFAEIYPYAFVNRDEQERLFGEKNPNILEMSNPDTVEQNSMRFMMAITLIKTYSENLRLQGGKLPPIFEIGRTYSLGPTPPSSFASIGEARQNLAESRKLGALLSGEYLLDHFPTSAVVKNAPIYGGKGLVDKLLGLLNIGGCRYEKISKDPPFSFLRVGWNIVREMEILGWIGELDTQKGNEFGISADQHLYLFELNLDILQRIQREIPTVNVPPSQVPVHRDLALVLDRTVPVRDIMELIGVAIGPVLREIELFDIYEGDQVPPGKKSLAFKLILQHPERSLSGDETDLLILSVLKRLKKEINAELRDFGRVRGATIFSDEALARELELLYAENVP